jgi:hypothetical protein
MKRYLLYICTFLALISGTDFHPLDNSVKNYTQIFFRWPQIESAEYYKILIYNEISSYEALVTVNSKIVEDVVTWGNDYSWIVCGYKSDDTMIDCYEEKNFSINVLPAYYPNQINLLVSNPTANHITILDFDSFNFSAAIDENGYPVWFVERNLFPGGINHRIVVTEYLESGNFIGYGFGRGYEFDIDGNIIFQTPENYGVHHHIIKRENSYFLIDAVQEDHPCPQPCPDNLPDIISWQADRFVQLDELGLLIKEWNLFDYIDLTEYNPLYLDRLSDSYPNELDMDWTHSNSIFFDNENLFVSIRNLSRIAKISYETNDLIWHVGNTDFMNQVYFESNLEFSQQHSAQVLSDNNIIFFDNHSLLDPELSRCIEFSYDESNFSLTQEWEYILPEFMFTGSRGECDRLANGNTLITAGRSGNMIEVDDNEIIWHLEAKHNNTSVTMYRGQRSQHLYPLAYSFEVDNLKGEYENYFLEHDAHLNFEIHNLGWSAQNYDYYILNQQQDTLLFDTCFIEPEDKEELQIDFVSLGFSNEEIYSLTISPINNSNFKQSLEFKYIGIFGDINNDQFVDVLDIISIINLILNSNYSVVADLNNDNVLNILDIIILINFIIYE